MKEFFLSRLAKLKFGSRPVHVRTRTQELSLLEDIDENPHPRIRTTNEGRLAAMRSHDCSCVLPLCCIHVCLRRVCE